MPKTPGEWIGAVIVVLILIALLGPLFHNGPWDEDEDDDEAA